MESCLQTISRDAASLSLMKTKPRSRLKQLMIDTSGWPKHSLGEAYQLFLEKNQYSQDLFPEHSFFNNLLTASDYINYRTWYYHDLIHIVCDFPTSRAGELGLLMFLFCQTHHPAIAAILLSDLSYLNINRDEPKNDLQKVKRWIGYAAQAARLAKPIFATPWEDWLEKSVASIRLDLNIMPIT